MKAKLDKHYQAQPIIQLFGDIVIFYISLWIAISLRQLSPVSIESYIASLAPYSIVFFIWLVVYLIEGLYERRAITSSHEIATSVVRAQIINGIIAIVFFYFLSNVSPTSRSILAMEVIIVMILAIIWRTSLHIFSTNQNRHPTLILSDNGQEGLQEALSADKANHPFILVSNPEKSRKYSDKDLKELLQKEKIRFLIADTQDVNFHKNFPSVSDLTLSNIDVFDIREVHETLFQTLPHSLLNHHWYIKEVKERELSGYRIAKRAMDIIVSLIGIIISLIFYPFIALAIKLEDNGPIFIKQNRIGKDNKIFPSYKFRSMKRNEDGVWLSESDNQVTKVGRFLRKTRLDELPQLFTVLFGHMSLIGPRPDMSGLAKRLSDEIMHYQIRTLVKPGITGWALVKQSYTPQSVEETRDRLGYDLYYIKNRSIALDLRILLQTIKTILKGNWSKERSRSR